jgi:cell fate regulator YaaT (PSP1 superfamily)
LSNAGYFGDSGEFEGAFSAAHAAGTHPASYHSNDPPFQLSSYVGPLWAVEFKSGRTEIFYVLEVDGVPQTRCSVGDLVIVEADRGEDLGRVTAEISVAKMRSCISGSDEDIGTDKNEISTELAALLRSKEIVPKRIHRLAQNSDLKLLQAKAQEEALAMVRCQSRIRQKKLPMDVVDAEYQWDRNKLTFYFIADRRIDFRELVRDLFRIYKTRIWMCAVDKTSPRMINYLGGLVPVHSAPLEEEEEEEEEDQMQKEPVLQPEPMAISLPKPTESKPSTISYKAVASHENL